MKSDSEEGSYSSLTDLCITPLQARELNRRNRRVLVVGARLVGVGARDPCEDFEPCGPQANKRALKGCPFIRILCTAPCHVR